MNDKSSPIQMGQIEQVILLIRGQHFKYLPRVFTQGKTACPTASKGDDHARRLPLQRFPQPQPEGPGGGASAGSWVLLQPERVNAYAQAVIRTLQADEHQRGCLMEERVLKGELAYESSKPLLVGEEDRFVLLAMLQALVERGV